MAGLKATTSRLATYRRQWEQLKAGSASWAAGAPADLTERTGFGLNPGQLRMLVHVPADLPARAPLVVVLHGCRQDAAGYGGNAGWTTLADRLGFAVLLPEQRPANNPNSCFNWFLPEDTSRDRGEAASIRQMIEAAVVEYHIDRKRIFVTGLSAGGAMTAAMLAAYPEVFAGGAIVAGLPYGVARNVQEALDAMFQGVDRSPNDWGDKVRSASAHCGPWPRLSIWHGSADATVKRSNADEIEKQWCNVHGLPLEAAESHRVDGQIRRVWRNAAGEEVIESYTVAGMAHGTPIAAALGENGGGTAAPFLLEAGIASTLRIAEFWGLAEHPNVSCSLRGQGQPSAARQEVIPQLDHPEASDKGWPPRRAHTPRSGNAISGVSARFGAEPQGVIEKALKAAGLIKR